MSTTTVRLPADLKARVTAAAKRSGTTAHHFILTAIEEKAARDEQEAEFHSDASARFEELARTGETIPWSEVKRWLSARARGEKARPPRPRKLSR